MHPSCLELAAFESDCRFRFSRASGPGGQHRNKVETSVTVEHVPSGWTATASEARQQGENRHVAIQRLRCMLAVKVRIAQPNAGGAAVEEAMPPEASSLWKTYCRSGKVRVSKENQHYPAMLAEALETLSRVDWDLARGALVLETSATQLIRLLASYPAALEELNRHLIARGRSPRSL